MIDFISASTPSSPSDRDTWLDLTPGTGGFKVYRSNAWELVIPETSIPELPTADTAPSDAVALIHSAAGASGRKDLQILVTSLIGEAGQPGADGQDGDGPPVEMARTDRMVLLEQTANQARMDKMVRPVRTGLLARTATTAGHLYSPSCPTAHVEYLD